MWREGMLYHEIARVFDTSCEAVHRLIRERVSTPELTAQAAGRLADARSSEERLLDGMGKAASVLAEPSAINAEDRRNAEAVINGWLAAHAQLVAARRLRSLSKPDEVSGEGCRGERLTRAQLRAELQRFQAEMRAAGLSESTIHAYLHGSSLFVRWLGGDYVPFSRPARPD
jgi:hypothetical protein